MKEYDINNLTKIVMDTLTGYEINGRLTGNATNLKVLSDEEEIGSLGFVLAKDEIWVASNRRSYDPAFRKIGKGIERKIPEIKVSYYCAFEYSQPKITPPPSLGRKIRGAIF